MEMLKVRIIGTRPMLMNSDKFADPLNPATKAHKVLTNKKKKTDDDHEAIAKSSWMASMHIDEKGPYLPGISIESSIVAGGKLSRLGTQLKRSIEIMDDRCYLEYTGPKTLEKMWNAGMYDCRAVKVGTSRIMRYRPIFKEWAATCTIIYDETSIDRAQVLSCLTDAGNYCGVGDYRPKFGRFKVEEVSE